VSREGALLLMVGVAVVLIGLMAWGWWRRTRRHGHLAAPYGDAPAGASVRGTYPILYVSTTVHDQALERLAIRGLAYRAAGSATVTDAGLALDLAGQRRMFLPVPRIDSVTQATVTIDRVVERDGLARIAWRLDDDTLVDSYVRPQDDSARALVAAIDAILPAHAATEGDS
jgi:hypothetical protein